MRPPPAVAFAVQAGQDALLDRRISTEEDLSFDVAVEAALVGARARFFGPVVQGPPAARFIYVRSGTMAGQENSFWTRRVKVPLSGLPWSTVLEASRASRRLEARIEGRATDGGPACATVRLIGGVWKPIA